MARSYVYEVDVTYFHDINTPSKAYWLGALAADGCLYYNHNKWVLQFIVSEKDQDLLLNLQAIFAEQCDIAPNKMRFHSNVWQWSIRGNRQIYRIAQYCYPAGDYPFLQRKRVGFEVT